MDELERQMGVMRDGVAPEWDAERSARVYAGIGQLQRRLAVRRAALVAGGSGFAIAVALLSLPGTHEPVSAPTAPVAVAAPVVAPTAPTAPVLASAPAEVAAPSRTLRLADGSRVELLTAESEVAVVRDEAEHVDLTLTSGAALFDVVPRADRTFEVAAGAWRVSVLGTRFELALEGAELGVSVEHGRVRVEGPGGVHEVGAGERVRLGAAVPAREARNAGRVRPVAPTAVATPSWRSSIQGGDYEAAYLALQSGAEVDDDPWALMDAADAARLSGHPEGAVEYLERLIRSHGASPVAPLAAFTLGRLQLDRLGQPHAAAEAFATALRLAPESSLAQDALAREVEAWSKAGAAEKAYTRAQAYVKRYPDGRRIKAVQRYGGLE